MYYGEAEIDGNQTIIIIRDGASFSLSPDIKVARKSKLELDESKNPLACKYGPLADIPQINPEGYQTLVNKLGGRLQGPTLMNNKPAELYSLKVEQTDNFPWNDFMIWLDKSSKLPIQVKYLEGTEQRTLEFMNVKTKMKVSPDKFAVPKDYKVIVFEWD